MSGNAEHQFEDAVIGGLFTRACGPIDGVPVLLSAGLGGAGAYWQPQIAALSKRHRVILYDHRGTGGSDRAPLPLPYSVSDLANDIAIILDGWAMGCAHIVGHAAGGVAALEFACMAPKRVRSLTIVNGWALADPHFVRCFEIRRAIYEAGGADAYLAAQPLFLFPASWISDNLEALDRQRAEHARHFQNAAALFARMDALRTVDVREALPDIACPVLAIAAADDMLVPARASIALAAPMRNARVATLPWGGHAVNVTAPEAFNELLLSFLGQHGPH